MIYFKMLKETRYKGLKESMTMMFHEMQDINKEMMKKKNLLEGLHSRFQL